MTMNNEILLRTNKGEYLPGETVCGAIYLHICRPTEANGIIISFKGHEKCVYIYECKGSNRLQNETVHVDFSDVNLYSQTESFEFGSYVFPFKFDLPKEIPGTFCCKGKTNQASWEVNIEYILRVKAVGADTLQATQVVVVYQVQEQALLNNKCGSACTTTYEVPAIFKRQKIHITAKLIENYVKTGSNLKLRLIVTNPTGSRVTRFRILLLRYLKLYVRDKNVDTRVLGNMEYSDDVCHIAPEGGPHETSSREGDLTSVNIDSLEMDKLQIPLREKLQAQETETDVPPSVVGKHVKNQYQLEVSIVFDNKHREVFNLPIPGVLPEPNLQWLQWRSPDWAFNAEIKLSKSLFSMQESTLRTEAFSGLPTFQVL